MLTRHLTHRDHSLALSSSTVRQNKAHTPLYTCYNMAALGPYELRCSPNPLFHLLTPCTPQRPSSSAPLILPACLPVCRLLTWLRSCSLRRTCILRRTRPLPNTGRRPWTGLRAAERRRRCSPRRTCNRRRTPPCRRNRTRPSTARRSQTTDARRHTTHRSRTKYRTRSRTLQADTHSSDRGV